MPSTSPLRTWDPPPATVEPCPKGLQHTSIRLYRQAQEIRLAKVLPGRFDDALELEIEHVPLVTPEPVPDERLSYVKLVETVPKPWSLYRNIEGRYLFFNKTTDVTQWEHPDPGVPRHMYHSDVVFGQLRNSKSHYEALSYVWGTDSALANVAILASSQHGVPRSDLPSASTIRIRQNLYEALKHLRYVDKPRALWIDALCINQHDLTEREAEVKRMGRIFKLASRVVVWLGCATTDGSSRHALMLMSYLGQQVEYTTMSSFLRAPNAKERLWYDYEIPLPYTKEDYSTIGKVLERPWWRRLWIWQEIILANSHAIFQCGLDSITWPLLRRAVVSFRSREEDSNIPFHGTIFAPYNLARDQNYVDVSNLIFRTRQALYTTPQDRIYALLGLMDPKFVETIQPDYTLPISNVFSSLCIDISRHYKHLRYLEYCDIAQATIKGMPSWVPNWSNLFGYQKLDVAFASGNSACSAEFHATGARLNSQTVACGTSACSAEFHTTGARLNTHMVACGNVEKLSSPAPLHGDMKSILPIWEAEFASGETDKEDFVLTLLADSIEERWPWRGNVAKAEIVRLYHSYIAGGDVGYFATQIARYAKGRILFRTDTQIGLCPASAHIGDVLCVVLGCSYPLLLRPCNGNATYKVVGPVYVSDLMNGEALLGPLPSDHTVSYMVDENGQEVEVFQQVDSGKHNFEDPRLGPLPDAWARVVDHENLRGITYKSRETGEEQWNDPRLTVEKLRERGVEVQQIVLE